ncbi:hypothetical protein K2173_027377 [Erythroxylum novogranatense]|uniref:Glycosyltransferase n=1 Tax=Erythroxylum novogranatense TaxID=1862640 RepID=A0AAV8U2C9_9ROSI|nr:hypothetical protein K2173_027377 [Erythroxylum novogranatense]
MSTPTTGAHILVYPFPSSGHFIPLLDLTRRLLTRGLTVTVAVTPGNLPLLDNSLLSHHLLLPDPSIDNLSAASGNIFLVYMRVLKETHYSILLEWFQSHKSPPVVILSDFFLGWTQDLASEVGVPRVVFSPSGALALLVVISNWRDQPRNPDPEEDMDFLVNYPKIPNFPSQPWWHISQLYRKGKEGDPDGEFFREFFLKNLLSWGIVFNSFEELESVYLHHMKQEFESGQVWAVGPVLPPDDDSTEVSNRGGSSSVPCQEVMTWLDSKPESSVVYVCFGSRSVLTRNQLKELATGLEKSGVNFVYCHRSADQRHQTSEDDGVLPEGFEDRVAGSGMGLVIKGWAPQVTILQHHAVGAFLTHCGWNSTLEGIAAGVVLLTWPLGADQYTNAQLLVDQLGVGIRVGEGTRKIPEATQLAQILIDSLDGTRTEKVKAKKLGAAAADAIQGGSADKELDEFVKLVNDLKIVREAV